MEAVCSSANNSSETHLWWKTIKAGVFKTDIIMDGFHRCAICTDKRFFFFLPCSKYDGWMCSCKKTEKNKVTLSDIKYTKSHAHAHVPTHAEQTCMRRSSNSRARQCRIASNWKDCTQNSNDGKSLLTFAWYSKCLSVGVTRAGFQNVSLPHFFLFCLLKKWLSFDGYYSVKIREETLGAAWLESTCQPAHEKRFSISEVWVNEMRLHLVSVIQFHLFSLSFFLSFLIYFAVNDSQ